MFTRFAPSMTGYLHTGHLLHLIYLSAFAKVYNLSIKLRIEDHDITRFKSDYQKVLFNDLNQFGFEWVKKPVFQSRSFSFYEEKLDQLYQQGLVYGCSCSRREIEVKQCANKKELHYSGTCSGKLLPIKGNTVRLRTSSESVSFNDIRLGKQTQCIQKQCGDFALKDRNGNYTYHFACVCDDIRMGITHIIRGEDILPSTGRQMYLYSLMNKEPPTYYHHPLKLDKDGNKLSKRNHAKSLFRQYDRGVSKEYLIADAIGASNPISFDDAVDYLINQNFN